MRPMAGAAISNLGPSYRFHYLPGSSESEVDRRALWTFCEAATR